MNKSVILIQPKYGPWDKLFCRLPESVLAIAALPYKEGYNVKILDQRVHSNWKGRLKELLKERPICCGITSLTGPSLKCALEAAALIKKIDRDIPIVFGGVHATLLPEQTLQHRNIDIVVKGEGDYTFYNIIKALEEKKPFDGIKGVYYKRCDEIVFTGEPDMILDLDALPDSPYELVDMDKYSAMNLGTGKSTSFPTSRGCPFACKFCANPTLHKNKWRGLSISKIIEKIKMFQERYHITTFYFLDDCTSYDLSHFREFIKGLASLDKKIYWATAGIRADLLSKLNDNDLSLLWESGCRTLEIGIESGNERVLKFINKAETKDMMRLANEKLAKYPIQIKYTFIIGFPTETDEELNDSLDFSEELCNANPNSYSLIAVYTPIFGTPMFNLAVQHGFVVPESIEEWIDVDYKSWLETHPNWLDSNKRRRLVVIMTLSLFSNKHAKVKLTTWFSKLAFTLYHPVAKFRFKHRFFAMPYEILIANRFFR